MCSRRQHAPRAPAPSVSRLPWQCLAFCVICAASALDDVRHAALARSCHRGGWVPEMRTSRSSTSLSCRRARCPATPSPRSGQQGSVWPSGSPCAAQALHCWSAVGWRSASLAPAKDNAFAMPSLRSGQQGSVQSQVLVLSAVHSGRQIALMPAIARRLCMNCAAGQHHGISRPLL